MQRGPTNIVRAIFGRSCDLILGRLDGIVRLDWGVGEVCSRRHADLVCKNLLGVKVDMFGFGKQIDCFVKRRMLSDINITST